MIHGKKRASNIELLRILSMFMIVIGHYFTHNGIANNMLPIGINRFLSEFLCFGTIGVAIFMITSGYFLGSSKQNLQISKLIKILLQVFFYSSIIFLLFALFCGEKPSMNNLAHSLAPVTFKAYWFVTVYVLIYLFHPFINKFLQTLTRSQYIKFICLSIFVFSFIKMVTGQDFYAGNAGLFLTYYAIGNYLRLYKDNLFSKRKNRVIILLSSIFAVATSIIVFDLLGGAFGAHSSHFISSGGTIFVLAIAVCMFCALAYARPFESKIVNIIASTTFGIYLIHDNYLVRGTVWTNIFHNADYINSPLMLLHMLGVVLLVFVACGAVELIRKNTLERFYVLVIAPRIDTVQTKISKNK